jgi:hypothetical protein
MGGGALYCPLWVSIMNPYLLMVGEHALYIEELNEEQKLCKLSTATGQPVIHVQSGDGIVRVE